MKIIDLVIFILLFVCPLLGVSLVLYGVYVTWDCDDTTGDTGNTPTKERDLTPWE